MKKILTFIVIVIIIIIVYLLFRSPVQAPEQSETLGSDATGAINADLQVIDVGDLNQEFQAIDKDLQNL